VPARERAPRRRLAAVYVSIVERAVCMALWRAAMARSKWWLSPMRRQGASQVTAVAGEDP